MMSQSRTLLRTGMFLGAICIGVASALAVTPNPAAARRACEKDKCNGLSCVDAGSSMYYCSITPGGSCVTGQCEPE